MEDFFLALREDLGHSNKGIERGDLIALFLKNSSVFLAAIKQNPNISFVELTSLEKEHEARSTKAG